MRSESPRMSHAPRVSVKVSTTFSNFTSQRRVSFEKRKDQARAIAVNRARKNFVADLYMKVPSAPRNTTQFLISNFEKNELTKTDIDTDMDAINENGTMTSFLNPQNTLELRA